MKYIWEELLIILGKFWDDLNPAFVLSIWFTFWINFIPLHKFFAVYPFSNQTYYIIFFIYWIINTTIVWCTCPIRSKVEVSITFTLSLIYILFWWGAAIYLMCLLICYIIMFIVDLPKKYKDLPDI